MVANVAQINADTALYGVALLAYHQEADTAVGVDFDTSFTRDLKRLAAQQYKATLARLELATFLQITIKTGQARIKEIVNQAKTAENKRQLLEEALRIQDKLKFASAMLGQLNGQY